MSTSRLFSLAWTFLAGVLLSVQPGYSAGSAKEKTRSAAKMTESTTRKGTGRETKSKQARAGNERKADKAGDKKKQADIAKARRQKAQEAAARRSRVASARGGADEEGSEMAEDLGDVNEGPGGAKIVQFSHVLYMKDGTKLKGSILMRGAKSLVVLTQNGELELHPDDVEQIGGSEEQSPPVYASTQIFEGHEYLTAPEIEAEEEEVVEEAEEEEEVVEEVVEEPKPETKMPTAPLIDGSTVSQPEPATTEVMQPVSDAIQSAVTPKTVKPARASATPKTSAPAVVTKTTVMDSQRPRPGSRKPAPAVIAAPKEDKKSMTDLLKSLESEDGLNSVLDQLKTNPDFFKSFDLKK